MMHQTHEYYQQLHEERVRKHLEEQKWMRELPRKQNRFLKALNQLRMFLW